MIYSTCARAPRRGPSAVRRSRRWTRRGGRVFGTVCVKLAEGCASELLGSALCVELVVPLRQGASPRDDGGTLDVLGFADFELACVVRGPQPAAAGVRSQGGPDRRRRRAVSRGRPIGADAGAGRNAAGLPVQRLHHCQAQRANRARGVPRAALARPPRRAISCFPNMTAFEASNKNKNWACVSGGGGNSSFLLPRSTKQAAAAARPRSLLLRRRGVRAYRRFLEPTRRFLAPAAVPRSPHRSALPAPPFPRLRPRCRRRAAIGPPCCCSLGFRVLGVCEFGMPASFFLNTAFVY